MSAQKTGSVYHGETPPGGAYSITIASVVIPSDATKVVVGIGHKYYNRFITGVAISGGGAAFTAAHADTVGPELTVHSNFWYLDSPTPGTVDIVVSFDNPVRGEAWAMSVKGAAAGIAAFVGITDGSKTQTIAASVGGLVLDMMVSDTPGTVAAHAGQTQLTPDPWQDGDGYSVAGGSSKPGAASVTTSWDVTGTWDTALTAIALDPAGSSVSKAVYAAHAMRPQTLLKR